MQKDFLLVDGYNIIHAWECLKETLAVSLESARIQLLDMLSNYQGLHQNTVIVVFDGHQVKGGTGSAQRHQGLYVIYTKEAETADHYIERSVNGLPKHYQVRVATSDALEQLIILGHGAARMTAKELYLEVIGSQQRMRKKYISNKPPKNNLLADNLDKEAQDWIENLRRKK